LNYKIPQQAWNEYEQSNFAPLGEAEAGDAGEQPARNSLTNEGLKQLVTCLFGRVLQSSTVVFINLKQSE
jgi:hypothetical protein